MEERKAWTKNDLHNGIVVFQSVQTEFGMLSAVYLGSGGVFVQTERVEDPNAFCALLKDLLHTTRLMLYSTGQGLYDPVSRSFRDAVSFEEMDAIAQTFASGLESPFSCATADIQSMCERLIRADAFARGWYQDEDGRVYLRHGAVFERHPRWMPTSCITLLCSAAPLVSTGSPWENSFPACCISLPVVCCCLDGRLTCCL